ncbi:hypothetical protein GGR54DRAFT_105416 [Hypoxylon sp. NC1633]|nr:hypothetical protein GGR54DRAFT_105416 [Hypoxylon sp. NC1633]
MAVSDPLLTGARVVVTGHDDKGVSVFQSDTVHEPFLPFGPNKSSVCAFDARESVPVNNLEPPLDLRGKIQRVSSTGVIFSMVTIAPQRSSPLHRTVSMDYCIVMSGELVLGLDGGDERTLKTGDFLVQCGANHIWHNRTDEVCRVAVIQVGSEKIKLPSGELLGEAIVRK